MMRMTWHDKLLGRSLKLTGRVFSGFQQFCTLCLGQNELDELVKNHAPIISLLKLLESELKEPLLERNFGVDKSQPGNEKITSLLLVQYASFLFVVLVEQVACQLKYLFSCIDHFSQILFLL